MTVPLLILVGLICAAVICAAVFVFPVLVESHRRAAETTGASPGPPAPVVDVDGTLRRVGWTTHAPLLEGALIELASALGGRLQRPVPPDMWCRVEGDLEGHGLDVAIRPGLTPAAEVELELRLRGWRQVPYLWIDRRSYDRLDASAFPPATLRLLADDDVRRRVSGLLNVPGAQHVELGAEARLSLRLTAATWRRLLDRERGDAPYAGYASQHLQRLLAGLLGLGLAAEAASGIESLALPGVSVAGRDSATICPYCREAPAELDLTRCPACATPHHTDCWDEAGGCTILGCRARPPGRPRTHLRQ